MHKEVTGLAGKLINLVIDIFLGFFLSIFILLAFGDTAAAVNIGYASEAKLGSVGS